VNSPARLRSTFTSQPFLTPSPSVHSLEQRLLSYSLSPGAAGVSLMALAFPAHAEILYAPAHAKLSHTSQFSLTTPS
jgi:hypothetical protein